MKSNLALGRAHECEKALQLNHVHEVAKYIQAKCGRCEHPPYVCNVCGWVYDEEFELEDYIYSEDELDLIYENFDKEDIHRIEEIED